MNGADSLTGAGQASPIGLVGERSTMPPRPDLLAIGRHPLTGMVESRLADRCGVPIRTDPPPLVVVGVSGGADSVALLLACAALRDRTHDSQPILLPHAIHVHHHLRPAADDDARFVKALCDGIDVPCRVAHIEPGRMGGNLAANARRMRYDALASAARDIGAAHVAVAHHADDQLETMLMALCRGGGLSRLRGMRWRRRLATPIDPPDASRPSLCLVRPLLEATHADCEDLCRAAGVPWRDDPTNRNIATARGRLRRDVVPGLRSLWPACSRHASMSADNLGAAHDLVEGELQRCFGPPQQRSWRRQTLRDLPIELLLAGLSRAIAARELPTAAQRSAHVQRTLRAAARAIASADNAPKHFQLATGHRIQVDARQVQFIDAAPPPHSEPHR